MKKSNENKRISTPKKLLILFAFILAIFGTINAIWYFGYKATYNELASKMDKTIDKFDGTTMRYTKTVDNYSFVLKMPAYLGEGGFLCVGDVEGAVTEYDNDDIISSNGTATTLYIWPQYWGEYKIGVDFYDEATDLWEQIYIDSSLTMLPSGNLDDQQIKYLEELLSYHSAEIQDLIEAAEALWEIDL